MLKTRRMRRMRKERLLASHGAFIFAHKKGIKHLGQIWSNTEWTSMPSRVCYLWQKKINITGEDHNGIFDDVAPSSEWNESERCQKRIKERILNSKKKNDMMWNSLAEGSIRSSTKKSSRSNRLLDEITIRIKNDDDDDEGVSEKVQIGEFHLIFHTHAKGI